MVLSGPGYRTALMMPVPREQRCRAGLGAAKLVERVKSQKSCSVISHRGETPFQSVALCLQAETAFLSSVCSCGM